MNSNFIKLAQTLRALSPGAQRLKNLFSQVEKLNKGRLTPNKLEAYTKATGRSPSTLKAPANLGVQSPANLGGVKNQLANKQLLSANLPITRLTSAPLVSARNVARGVGLGAVPAVGLGAGLAMSNRPTDLSGLSVASPAEQAADMSAAETADEYSPLGDVAGDEDAFMPSPLGNDAVAAMTTQVPSVMLQNKDNANLALGAASPGAAPASYDAARRALTSSSPFQQPNNNLSIEGGNLVSGQRANSLPTMQGSNEFNSNLPIVDPLSEEAELLPEYTRLMGSYNPNSRLDQAKMRYLLDLAEQGVDLNPRNVYDTRRGYGNWQNYSE